MITVGIDVGASFHVAAILGEGDHPDLGGVRGAGALELVLEEAPVLVDEIADAAGQNQRQRDDRPR